MRPSRTALRFVAACTAASLLALVPVGARAQSLDELKKQEASARRQAERAAAAVTDAIGEWNRIHHEIEAIEATIEAKRARATELGTLAVNRAVRAYKNAGSAGLEILDAADLLEASRRARLLGTVTQQDAETVDRLDVEATDLAADEERLRELRDEQQKVIDARRAAEAELEKKLNDLTAKRKRVEAQLAARSSQRSGGSAPAPIGGLVCPLPGSVFSDTWGAPRSGGRRHKGTDMMAPFGAPVYAVVSGTTRQRSGGLAGLGIWLNGDDGNVYFYAHLQEFVGASGRVSQGQLIGRNGNTGNARGGAPHVHFEIKRGGYLSINPYPTLRRIC